MFVGGRDAYSAIQLAGLEMRTGTEIAEKVREAIFEKKLRSVALRWYLRGLNIDLAIQKAYADARVYCPRTKHAS